MEIKFCGGCNPLYHREKLYKKLNFLPQRDDLIILLNGCQRGCRKNLGNKKVINIQEYLIGTNRFDEEEILKWIIEKIK